MPLLTASSLCSSQTLLWLNLFLTTLTTAILLASLVIVAQFWSTHSEQFEDIFLVVEELKEMQGQVGTIKGDAQEVKVLVQEIYNLLF